MPEASLDSIHEDIKNLHDEVIESKKAPKSKSRTIIMIFMFGLMIVLYVLVIQFINWGDIIDVLKILLNR